MHPVDIESHEKIPNAQLAVVIAMPLSCHRDVSDARTKQCGRLGAKKPDGYLLGSYRIATAPEPNSTRPTSLKSTRFDSPANKVGPWPTSWGEPRTRTHRSIPAPPTPAGASRLPPAVSAPSIRRNTALAVEGKSVVEARHRHPVRLAASASSARPISACTMPVFFPVFGSMKSPSLAKAITLATAPEFCVDVGRMIATGPKLGFTK